MNEADRLAPVSELSVDEKVVSWLSSIQSALQHEADMQAQAELVSDPTVLGGNQERNFSSGEISSGDRKFLGNLSEWASDVHFRRTLSTLEDRRNTFMADNNVDIIIEQYTALRLVLPNS